MNSTTDLETIRKEPHRFTWGEVIEINDLGRYTFVKHKSNFAYDDPSIHIYVDGKDIGRGSATMEYAMLTAIAFGKIQNSNEASWMVTAAMKLFEPEQGLIPSVHGSKQVI